MSKKTKKSAQTFLEYAMLVSTVVAVLVSFTPLLRRGAQGMIKVVADQIGNQTDAEQPGGLDGQLDEQTTDVTSVTVKRTRENLGEVSYIYDGTNSRTITATSTNLGFRYD